MDDFSYAMVLLVIAAASHGQLWYDGNAWQIFGRGLLAVTVISVIALLSFDRSEWLVVAFIGWSLSIVMGIAGFVAWRKDLKGPPASRSYMGPARRRRP
jgi:hypothetical protein